MRWSFRIATIAGIRIEVHVTFLLLLAAIPLFTTRNAEDAMQVALQLVLVFGIVLLHELGHALAARRFGILTREIVLLPIGGVAKLERMPERPGQEIVVALAGPAVNLALALAIAGALRLTNHTVADVLATRGLLEFLFWVNGVMLLFNLIPAFPMDGGRVLRALLAFRLPFARATRIAATVGQAFALLFALAGLFVLKNPMLVFVALFVFMAAGEERSMVQTRTSLGGLPVRTAMLTTFDTVDVRDEIGRAVDLLLAGSQHDFPVLEDGRLLGMLSRDDLIRGLRKEGGEAPIGRIARLDVHPVDPHASLETTLQRMRAESRSALPVVEHDRLVGLLTLENVGELLLVQDARRRRAGTA